MKTASLRLPSEILLDNIGDGVILADKNGKIVLANRRAAELLSWPQEEMIGKPFFEVAPMYDSEGNLVSAENRPLAAVLGEGKSMASDPSAPTRYYGRKDGSRFPISFTKTPVRSAGKVVGAIEVFRDVTMGKEIDRAKSEFVSLASHQLRTPLSIISLYSELLKKGWNTNFDKAEYETYVDAIYEAMERMTDLIDDLLTVSRIDTETLAIEIELVNLGRVAERVLKDFGPAIKKKNLVIKKSYDPHSPMLYTDIRLIQILLQNLVSNAVKYTPPYGQITISIKGNTDHALISVADTGYGIPEADRGEIFKKFFRADNVKAVESEGTGLGLYIAKSIMDRLGGSIWFESIRNRGGTTFSVKLPQKNLLPLSL